MIEGQPGALRKSSRNGDTGCQWTEFDTALSDWGDSAKNTVRHLLASLRYAHAKQLIDDGVLPLLFPPEHYFTVRPLVANGERKRAQGALALDLAACIWVSLSEDRAAARRVLARKVAYYGHALSPLIWERLDVTQAEFAPITDALMVRRDEESALAMVDERMLAIGVVGGAEEVIARLEPLVAAGVRHLSFGPPLGPNPLAAVELLGTRVLPHFRGIA